MACQLLNGKAIKYRLVHGGEMKYTIKRWYTLCELFDFYLIVLFESTLDIGFQNTPTVIK